MTTGENVAVSPDVSRYTRSHGTRKAAGHD